MIYNFELHSSCYPNLNLSVDDNITTAELLVEVLNKINHHTSFTGDDILDIFVQDGISNNTLSIPVSQTSIKQFISCNKIYFPVSAIQKHTYRLYIIDRVGCDKLKTKMNDQPDNMQENDIKIQENDIKMRKNDINTHYSFGFVDTLKSIFSIK